MRTQGQIDPKDKTALSYLASLTFNEKRLDEAITWNDRLIEVDPQNTEALVSASHIKNHFEFYCWERINSTTASEPAPSLCACRAPRVRMRSGSLWSIR